jgi:mono/diheme cytochrome c family protein
MYAYFRTVTPVRRVNRAPELRFPYNRRALMMLWRALYFRPGVHKDDPRQPREWNRGAYLVLGLGHCSACHASRNVLGAVTSDDFSGGLLPAQNWYAPALSSESETSLAKWPLEDLAAFLRTGASQGAAAYGPMAAVIRHGLQYLNAADIASMATYLRSQVQPADKRAPATHMVDRTMEHGAHIYERHCAQCHGANGEGVPRIYPALAGNRSILTEVAVNPIRIVYAGGFPPSTAGNPRPFGMPPFYQDLSDYDVAAVVTYIRRSWGNDAPPVSQADAARLRGVPAE